jgi:hypothetical protein
VQRSVNCHWSRKVALADAPWCQGEHSVALCAPFAKRERRSLTEVLEPWDVSKAVGRLHHFVDHVQCRLAHARRRCERRRVTKGDALHLRLHGAVALP